MTANDDLRAEGLRDALIRELDARIPPMDWPDRMADRVLTAIDAALAATPSAEGLPVVTEDGEPHVMQDFPRDQWNAFTAGYVWGQRSMNDDLRRALERLRSKVSLHRLVGFIDEEIAALAARSEPRAEGLRLDRWIDSLTEDANGTVWVTKAELRSVLLAATPLAEGLDVERLRRAIERWYRTPVTIATTAPRDSAEWIIREYVLAAIDAAIPEGAVREGTDA